MKKSYSLQQAWDILDKKYPYKNVYDTYVLKEDWLAVMDNMDKRADAEANLNSIERSFGITELYEKIQSLTDRITALELPSGSGWKLSLSEEAADEIKKRQKALRKERELLETRIDEISETIRVEPEMLGLKN